MPKYVWIPYRGMFWGIDTGTWGGYTQALNIKTDESKLHELIHQTYYA